jgi:hypothetical protein
VSGGEVVTPADASASGIAIAIAGWNSGGESGGRSG